jgi:DeoR family suf operon transcriptional repressor
VPADSSSLATIPATRRQLLLHVKKRGEATADELAAALEITPSAVRQHLAALAADGLVEHRSQRAGAGRPHHLYRLTEDGELLFPRAYGTLTTELLEYVEDADPALLGSIFERRARRRLEQTQHRLAGKPFAGRVAELARILDEDGYLADVEVADDGTWRIIEHNCAILTVAQRYGHACSSELDYLRAALPDASIDRVAHLLAGAHVCAYEIRPTEPQEEADGHRRSRRRGIPRAAGRRAAR